MSGSNPPPLFCYQVSGWTVGSCLPLPYLLETAPAVSPDIVVEFGSWPSPPTPPAQDLGRFQIHAPNLVDLIGPDGIRIRIADGRRMIVDAPDGAEATVHTLLFGAAFAVLCFQRRSPALHAGAVVLDGAALAIAGHSGAGKSTITRALMGRGLPLLTDDQLRIEPATAIAYPGFPSNKLWADSAARLGELAEPAHRVAPGFEKFHVAATGGFEARATPLKAVFALAPTPDLTEPDVTRLSPPQAVATLGSLIHYRHVGAALGLEADLFAWAHSLARTVPVYLVRRTNDLAGLEQLVDMVIDRFSAAPTEALP